MKLKNKILSAFLLVCLLVTALPTAFMAEEGETTEKTFYVCCHSEKDEAGAETALDGTRVSIGVCNDPTGTSVSIADSSTNGENECQVYYNENYFVFEETEYTYLRVVYYGPEGYYNGLARIETWTVEEFVEAIGNESELEVLLPVEKEPVCTYEELVQPAINGMAATRTYIDGKYEYTSLSVEVTSDDASAIEKVFGYLDETIDTAVGYITITVTGEGLPTISKEAMELMESYGAYMNLINRDTYNEYYDVADHVFWTPVKANGDFEFKVAENESVEAELDAAKIPHVLLSVKGINGDENIQGWQTLEHGILKDGQYDETLEVCFSTKCLYYYDSSKELFVLVDDGFVYESFYDEEYPEDTIAYIGFYGGEKFANDGYYVIVDEKLPISLTTEQSENPVTPPTLGGGAEAEQEIKVSWSATKPWTVEFKDAMTAGQREEYYAWVIKDGKRVDNMWIGDWEDDKVSADISQIVAYFGAGEYQVEIELTRMDATGAWSVVASGTSETCTYVDPGKSLATPEITFSEDGVISFNLVDGADYYELVVIYQSVVNGDGGYDNGYILYPSDSKDGKTITFDYSEVYADVDDWDANFVACVKAYSNDINVVKNSEWSEDSNVWELRMSKDKAEEKLEAALKSENPEEVKGALESIANETVIEIMKEDITEIKKAEEAWAEAKGIKVETKSEVETVDASKISIVGAAFNANGIDEKEVVLSVKEPEKKVEVDTKYSNAVALDIELFVAGVARENLTVPVAITMPIPEGVEKENLVILHYHGDEEEPVVLVPTVNEDGTMTFYVDGFSTFVIANQVVEAETTSPKTGDASGTAFVCSLLLLAAGVVLMKRNAFAK